MIKKGLLCLLFLFILLQESGLSSAPALAHTAAAGDTTLVTADSIPFAIIPYDSTAKHNWDPQWNRYIAAEIKLHPKQFFDTTLIARSDLDPLCPGFCKAGEQQKIAFWTLFIASIAKYESGFDTACRYKENASLNYVYSEGLLQLSYGDEKNYPGVLLSTAKKNIFSPEVNLRTGVLILAKQIEKRKILFTRKHFYWSVLTNKQKEIIRFFREHRGSFCL